LYQTARLNPRVRAFLVDQAELVGVSRTARNSGVSRRTVYRWLRRAPNFADRSSRPHRSPRRCSDALEATVLAVRMEERAGPDRIGPSLGLPPSTVHRILRRHGAQRLSHLFPKPRRGLGQFPPLAPGELVALDMKSFGSLDRGGGRRAEMHRNSRTGVGWRHLHVAIDMASRLVFTELRAGLASADTIAFLERARAFVADGSSPTTARATAAMPSKRPATRPDCATPAPSHGTPGPTAGSSDSSGRSSGSAPTATASPANLSARLRSRSLSPTTTTDARTPPSRASRRQAGYADSV
jgi:hypothetical protein